MEFDPGKLRTERRRCKLRQKDVASALNISPATVCGWENGNIRVSGETLAKLAEIYGTDLLWFFSTRLKKEYEIHKKKK